MPLITSLLKVLYLSYIETVGFIWGKYIFITANTILWNSDSPISIPVALQKLSVLFVNNKSMKDCFDFLSKYGVSLGYTIWKFLKQQSLENMHPWIKITKWNHISVFWWMSVYAPGKAIQLWFYVALFWIVKTFQ